MSANAAPALDAPRRASDKRGWPRTGAVVAVALLAAFLVWLLLIRDGGGSAPAAGAGPVAVSEDDLAALAERGGAALGAELDPSVARLVARRAGGDARNALNIVELAAASARAQGVAVAEEHVEDASRKRPLVYDKGGDAHYDFISAFIKSIRGSDPDAAVYYLAAMIEGGEDPRYIARRLIVHASEDIGNADPRALLVAVAAAQAVEHVGLPEARLNLAQATIYLACAPKSNASYLAIAEAIADVREHGHLRPPDALRDASYRGAKKLGRGKGYIYPHDDPRGFEVDYLPDALKGRRYYRPRGSGEEAAPQPPDEADPAEAGATDAAKAGPRSRERDASDGEKPSTGTREPDSPPGGGAARA